MKKKRSSSNIRVDAEMIETRHTKDATLEASGAKKKSQKLREKKRKKSETARTGPSQTHEVEDTILNSVSAVGEPSEDQLLKPRKKKKKKNVEIVQSNEKNDAPQQCNGKSKNPGKKKRTRQLVSYHISSDNLVETREENAEEEVYQMSSGDEDYSKGMKKWVTQYHQSRPGLKVLQERIDDFIMAHEAREEQARAEKLAQAAEGGWTVVVHQKGRKKTTEAESGVAVGSVAQAAVLDKMGKKKKKEVGLDFYQFNRREAHRNEIMMLQSKFEQDKKRIQQMRAARKFRPY